MTIHPVVVDNSVQTKVADRPTEQVYTVSVAEEPAFKAYVTSYPNSAIHRMKEYIFHTFQGEAVYRYNSLILQYQEDIIKRLEKCFWLQCGVYLIQRYLDGTLYLCYYRQYYSQHSCCSFILCDSPYLGFVLLCSGRILGVGVAVCLLHADQLQLEVRHLVHQIQLLSLQRGPAHQLLGKTHTATVSYKCGKPHESSLYKPHLQKTSTHAQISASYAVRSQHAAPLGTMFFPHEQIRRGWGPRPHGAKYTHSHTHRQASQGLY